MMISGAGQVVYAAIEAKHFFFLQQGFAATLAEAGVKEVGEACP
jgi:hypothetical protein